MIILEERDEMVMIIRHSISKVFFLFFSFMEKTKIFFIFKFEAKYLKQFILKINKLLAVCEGVKKQKPPFDFLFLATIP